jgi:hypothetical protein
MLSSCPDGVKSISHAYGKKTRLEWTVICFQGDQRSDVQARLQCVPELVC